MHHKEAELIARCKNNDKRAFGELILKYQKRVFNVAYRMLGEYEEAKDITQEAFIRAYKSMANFREDACFYTWIYRIAINLTKNKMKNWARHPKPEPIDAPIETSEGEISRTLDDKELPPDKIILKKETQAYVQKAINCLRIEYKAVIILRDIQGLSYQEIADSLGCREGTVKSRLSRARLILKEKLKGVVKNGL